MSSVRLMLGDCLDRLKEIAGGSIDAIVTDPPYELGFMGKGWDATGIANNVQMWREALRVLKPGGHLLAFSGSRTYHRMACAIEEAGFEVRDQIQWIYGSGFPKSRNIGNGWGTALKPAHEPIVMARKPLAKGRTVAANVLAHGTGAINVDGCRVGDSGATRKIASEARDNSAGCYGNGLNGGGGERNLPFGRWPANVIHDGSDEVVGAFPAQAGGGFGKRGASTEIYGGGKGFTSATMETVGYGDSGSAARFFYCAKASKADRDAGLEDMPLRPSYMVENGSKTSGLDGGRYERTTLNRNIHPTVKPRALMAYLCKLVTPPGGTVLDPFMGSGSTGIGAVMGGFRFVGIDMTPEYFDIAGKRITKAQSEQSEQVVRNDPQLSFLEAAE